MAIDRVRGPARTLHVLGHMQPGGVEVRLLELMGRMPRSEFRIDVCALSGRAGLLDGQVRALGGEVLSIPLRSPWFAGRFLDLVRRGAYRIVHSHVLYASGPILALASRGGARVRVAHFHSTHDGRRRTLPRRAARTIMRGLIGRYATDIVACGEGVMEAVWGPAWQLDPRCQVIYDAIDVGRFERPEDRRAIRADLGVPESCRLFLHVGRQSPPKNHARLLAIFAEIARIDPSSWLVLAGAGPEDPDGAVARLAGDLGIAERVLRLGVRDDVPRLLAAADALLLPSRWEGLPNVVLESCAAGVPVLATDLPGVREIASRLSLVRSLPLSATDRAWASAALALPGEADALRLRERAIERFRPSVFHVDRAVEAHRHLWGRATEEEWARCS